MSSWNKGIVCVHILVEFNADEPGNYYDSKMKLSIISLSYKNIMKDAYLKQGLYNVINFSS